MKYDQNLYTYFDTDFIFLNECIIVIDFFIILINQFSYIFSLSLFHTYTLIFLYQKIRSQI